MNVKEQLDDIRNRITALETRPSWLDRIDYKWVIGTLLAFAAMILGVLVLWREINKDHFNLSVDDRIDKKQLAIYTKLGEMDTKLTSISASLETLKPFIEELVKREMAKAAALPEKDFRANLPAIQHLIATARSQKVSVDPALVAKLGQKILAIQPRVPDFWPVSAELVSYRSSNTAPSNLISAAKASSRSLPECTDSPPVPMKITEVINPNQAKFSRGLYENCRITLDSPQDDDRLNKYLTEQTPLITFKHCLVVYRGGPVNLLIGWKDQPTTLNIEGHPPMHVALNGPTIEFENCLFDFSIQGVPPKQGQQLTETLLAQNTSTLNLP